MANDPNAGGPPEVAVVSHYRIVQKLRSGGMSDVYLAEDTVLPRVVALKLLPQDRSADDTLQQRFMREARAASSLSHPNIARVYEAGKDGGRVFIAMEYVAGESLETRISRGSLGIDEIVTIAIQLVGAVAEAHKSGIVHRDLKPSNVMLTATGEVKVLDFGLAKFDEPEAAPIDTTAWKTESGIVLGTIPYMSPEQALGKKADTRSDIFSIGVVLYELVTGRLPFSGSGAADTLFRVVNAQPEAMARFNYDLPPELERIIRKCMEKAPDRRYQTTAELLVDLRNFDRDRHSGTPRKLGGTFIRRHKVGMAAGAIGLLVIIAAAAFLLEQRARSRAMPSNPEAYTLYVKARQDWSTRTESGLKSALDLFRQTVEIEPDFAPAWAGLAYTYSLLERYAGEPSADSRAKAIHAATKAIEIEPGLADAHTAHASVLETYDWKWEEAAREYTKAIARDPMDSTAHHWYALLLTRLGRFREASVQIGIARALDSDSPAIAAAIANIDYYRGSFGQSVEHARAALSLDEHFNLARSQLVLSLVMVSDLQNASRELQPLLAQQAKEALFLKAIIDARSRNLEAARAFLHAVEARPEAKRYAYYLAAVHVACGDSADALRWLDTAVTMRSVWVGYLAVDPLFVSLRGDPRFQTLLRRIGLLNHAS